MTDEEQALLHELNKRLTISANNRTHLIHDIDAPDFAEKWERIRQWDIDHVKPLMLKIHALRTRE